MKKRLFTAVLCLALCACPLTVMAEDSSPLSIVSMDSGMITVEGGLPEGIQMVVREGGRPEEVLAAARDLYPGSTPNILWYRDITYLDPSGSPYVTDGDLLIPVPEGYDEGKSIHVVTLIGGALYDTAAELRGDVLCIRSGTLMDNVIVLDAPIALTGIELPEKVSVNAGQHTKLRVETVPGTATEDYELEWESSDGRVASVDASGVVTGISSGRCTVSASVRGKPGMKASCAVTVVSGTHALSRSVPEVLAETRDYMLKIDKSPTVGSEWFALGLARGGLDLDNKYFKTYYNHFANYLAENKGVLTSTVKYTEYSRTIVALTAIGADARDVGGYNLFKPLADFETVCEQGINGPIWALIAMNCHPDYEIPEVPGVADQTTEAKLVSYILENETPLSGWSLVGDSPDPDITGMALQALAPYYGRDGYAEVTAAVDRALDALSAIQDSEGGYSSWGAKASESSVQVLTGLCALGIDPAADERFVKGGAWLVENLLSFHVDGSGFMHVKPGSDGNGGAEAGVVDGMATEQGYYALVAYQRFLDGKTALYDMSDVKISPGGKGDGKGTGLEAPATPTVTPKPTATPTPRPTSTPGGSTGKQLGVSNSSGNTGKRLNSSSASSSSGKTAGNTGSRSDPDGSDDGSGWDFEAEDYAFDSGSGDTGWDAGAIEEAPMEMGVPEAAYRADESRGEAPMLMMWFFGGLCGVGGMAGMKPLGRFRRQMCLQGDAPGGSGRRDPRVVLIGWLSGLQDLLERSLGR